MAELSRRSIACCGPLIARRLSVGAGRVWRHGFVNRVTQDISSIRTHLADVYSQYVELFDSLLEEGRRDNSPR